MSSAKVAAILSRPQCAKHERKTNLTIFNFQHKVTGPTPLKMLQEVMTLDLMEVANTLVKMYLGQGKIVSYLDVVCTEEIQATSKLTHWTLRDGVVILKV